MKKTFLFTLILQIIFSISCTEKQDSLRINKFSDESIRRIAQLSDERKGIALCEFLGSPDAALRQEAAYAFASIRDTSLTDSLEKLLLDSISGVRLAVAYSLGQTANPGSFTALSSAVESETDPAVKGAIYEAVGKIAAQCIATNLSNEVVESSINLLDFARFETEDERLGWAKGAFQIHMAGNTDQRLMNRMPFVLQKTAGDSRVMCAYAMARFKGEWFSDPKNQEYILSWCKTERSADVRMLQMTLLAKINTTDSRSALLGYLSSNSQESTVKIAALRAASKMISVTADDILPLLDDQDDYVVAECLAALTTKSYTSKMETILSKCSARGAALHGAALRLKSLAQEGNCGTEIWSAFSQAKETFDKVHYAHALGTAPSHAAECVKSIFEETAFPVKYALTEALIEMHHYKLWPAKLDYLEYCLRLLDTGDVGVVSLIATDLREQSIPFDKKNLIHEMLMKQLATLELPKDIETYNEVVRTVNYIGIEKKEEQKASFNHPINWDEVAKIPALQKVMVNTSQGSFIMELHVEDAPGSVVNLVQLVKEGFYHGKYFHRVIPNFVIQGGCPRGDGMGSTDYTIRSEFRLHDYIAGAVGLASSGPDTESCQWFVSHIPTPHLEGRYTILGYVTSGLDIVRKINVGDTIVSMELIK